MGQFVPQCDANGNFKSIQTNQRQDFCVDAKGNQISVAVDPAQQTLSCSSARYLFVTEQPTTTEKQWQKQEVQQRAADYEII